MGVDKAAIAKARHEALRDARNDVEEARYILQTSRDHLAFIADAMGISLEEPEPEPDYEALGYPETRAWHTLFETLEQSALYYPHCRDIMMPMYMEMLDLGQIAIVDHGAKLAAGAPWVKKEDMEKKNQDDTENG